MTKRPSPLRVGFDMDGVLLYNPTRVIRPLVSFIKRIFLHKKKLRFYYPKTNYEKIFWRLVHKSSFINAQGIHEITRLVNDGEIEAYLITARYNFLGSTVEGWVKKNKLEKTFKGVFYNSKDEQPHEFKERMIKMLNLDIYVEDNFDIVNYLAKKTSSEIFWIYNILDKETPFPKKFPHLKNVIDILNHE